MNTEKTQISTPEITTLKTGVSFTGNTLDISQSTPLEYEVLSTDEISNIKQGTTLKLEVSSNNENNIGTALRTEASFTDQNSNISQSTITEFHGKKGLTVKSSKHLITYN